ncbi:hypothetical protein BDY19DRAFT_450105 [Irpex rosettiformis]|uniref:Uncharacterized protein n=1 Tax=Irpex rosettiformis TaxID=378272 RepID=A0ACB8TTF4_9APHY|nr:hypothetical protein BDY19DRAFT_450105 [Irpex rosettiformis]
MIHEVVYGRCVDQGHGVNIVFSMPIQVAVTVCGHRTSSSFCVTVQGPPLKSKISVHIDESALMYASVFERVFDFLEHSPTATTAHSLILSNTSSLLATTTRNADRREKHNHSTRSLVTPIKVRCPRLDCIRIPGGRSPSPTDNLWLRGRASKTIEWCSR